VGIAAPVVNDGPNTRCAGRPGEPGHFSAISATNSHDLPSALTLNSHPRGNQGQRYKNRIKNTAQIDQPRLRLIPGGRFPSYDFDSFNGEPATQHYSPEPLEKGSIHYVLCMSYLGGEG
jgi:hypothetical protein